MLTESGRILTWGSDNDGLLGREIFQGDKLNSQHFNSEIFKLKPPRTCAEKPGLVAHISLMRPVTRIEVAEGKVHAYLCDVAPPPPDSWKLPILVEETKIEAPPIVKK